MTTPPTEQITRQKLSDQVFDRLWGMVSSGELAPGDTMSVPENVMHNAVPSMTGEASLYHIVATDDAPGATWTGA